VGNLRETSSSDNHKVVALPIVTTLPPRLHCSRSGQVSTRIQPQLQSVIERLPACLSGEDAAMLADSGAAPRELPDVPGVVIVPGTGPRTVDYSAAGGHTFQQRACRLLAIIRITAPTLDQIQSAHTLDWCAACTCGRGAKPARGSACVQGRQRTPMSGGNARGCGASERAPRRPQAARRWSSAARRGGVGDARRP